MAAVRPVPKNRGTITGGEWFPYVISKIAPLESWAFVASMGDVKLEYYSSDFSYQLARQNTWEFPRFCFSMFRPRVEDWIALYKAVNQYEGGTAWLMHDGCIAAIAAKGFTGYAPILSEEGMKALEEAIRNPPKADPEFVKKAMADIPNFCGYLEKRLGLTDKAPVDFDPRWLTREGLAESRGELDDFFEPGDWSVFLARDPVLFAKTSRTSPADRALRFGIGMLEHGELFTELGAEWKDRDQQQPALTQYPLLSRLGDITSNATYAPDEVDSFLAELLRAQQVVRDPKSIRGLDKLIRIAKWAQKFQLGIYFGGQ